MGSLGELESSAAWNEEGLSVSLALVDSAVSVEREAELAGSSFDEQPAPAIMRAERKAMMNGRLIMNAP